MKILSLFDCSGVMVAPWVDAGHSVLCIDQQEPKHRFGNIQIDIRHLSADEFHPFDVVFAFPPCTHLAVSGALHWKKKGPEALEQSLELVRIARSFCDKATYWLIENPVGRLSSHWRKPDWSFNPFEYAGYSPDPDKDRYTKKTCIWSNFEKPKRKPLSPIHGSKMHLLPPGPNRQYLRSLTPQGFAQAIYEHLSSSPPAQIALF